MRAPSIVNLDSVCPLPDPLRSLEQWRRAVHADLSEMPPTALRLEYEQCRLRLLLDPAPDSWLAERMHAVEAAIDAGAA